MKDGLYSTSEAARLVGVSRATLLRRVAAGDIVPDRTDSVTRYHSFSRRTIDDYLASRYRQSPPAPVSPAGSGSFSFIDLFAGIGGIRLGFEAAGGECVFSSEIDKYAIKTACHNFPDIIQMGDAYQVREWKKDAAKNSTCTSNLCRMI